MSESEYTAIEIEMAEKALDLIDGAAKKAIAIAEDIIRNPAVEYATVKSWNQFKGEIEDAFSDLFNNERNRLIKITGWQDHPKSLMECLHTSDINEQLANLAAFKESL